MTKSRPRPIAGPSRRSSLAHSAWNVEIHRPPGVVAEDAGDALPHLLRGLVGEGDGEDLALLRQAGPDQVGDAVGDDARLARAGAGEDEQRPSVCSTAARCSGFSPSSAIHDARRMLRPRRRNTASFDRDALGEVARLVDVAAAAHGDVVREQLQRDTVTTGASSGGAAGSEIFESSSGSRMWSRRSSPLVGERDDHAAARLHLLDVAEHLLEHARRCGAITTTGSFSSISAIGPCFISPAG